MSLIEQTKGNYRFLPGISPYSRGAVAMADYEIVHVTLQHPIAYREGLQQIAKYLKTESRPKAALCAVELRSPSPFSFAGFAELNAEYSAVLEHWGVFVDGINPVARTNVAPVTRQPSEPVLYGFSFTRPRRAATPTFVVAGAGELPEGVLARDQIVALGDTSPAGMTTKASMVMQLMEQRLNGLGATWSQVTQINVYTAHSPSSLIREVVMARAESSSLDGVTWHYSRPPVEDIEFEMDMRATCAELRWNCR